MRARNIAADLEVYGVAGTHTAVLSFDFKTKPQGLLGFAIERRDQTTGKIIWLEGQKCFKSIVPNPVKGQKYPSFLHPIQSFMWKDFTLVPGCSYVFKITPVFGRPDQLQYGAPTLLTLAAEAEWNGKHGVYFNRGVSGSQSYSERFPAGKISAMDAATRERAFEWLSRGLLEGLRAFIERAKPGESLRGAFYEFHEPRTLALLKAARTRGVDVELVVDGKQYGTDNRAAVTKAGIAGMVKRWREHAKIPHNKFLVRSSGDGTPTEVWTGSTNISEKGIFGQCNTGHVVKGRSVGKKYLDYWKALKADPDRGTLVPNVMGLQADVAADTLASDEVTVFFSPRDSLAMLDAYAELVADAQSMACGMFPFNVDQRFQNTFNQPKDFPRYVIVDKSSERFTPNDTDLDVTEGAYIKNPIDQWVREKSAATLFYSGTDYIHNKLLIVDPLGNAPKIVVGSANLSQPSTTGNDENMLVLKGPAFMREADIYLTEFIRLFDHFDFRAWLNSHASEFKPFLEEGPAANGASWVDKYFDSAEYLSFKRKMVFKNMVLA